MNCQSILIVCISLFTYIYLTLHAPLQVINSDTCYFATPFVWGKQIKRENRFSKTFVDHLITHSFHFKISLSCKQEILGKGSKFLHHNCEPTPETPSPNLTLCSVKMSVCLRSYRWILRWLQHWGMLTKHNIVWCSVSRHAAVLSDFMDYDLAACPGFHLPLKPDRRP